MEAMQSYRLPEGYDYDLDKENTLNDANYIGTVDDNDDGRNNNDDNDDDDMPRKGPSSSRALLFHNPQLLSRYKSARYEYLRQRTMDTFVSEVLPTFCDDRGSFALPEAISEEE